MIDHISDDHISDDHISDDQISDDHISDDQISDDHISDDHISDDQISDDRTRDDHISEDEISDRDSHQPVALPPGTDLDFGRRAIRVIPIHCPAGLAPRGSPLATAAPFARSPRWPHSSTRHCGSIRSRRLHLLI